MDRHNHLEGFSPTVTKVDRYISIKSAVERVDGLITFEQTEFLFNKIKTLPDNATIIEIGSWKGRSTVAMGYACKGTKRLIYCIDPWYHFLDIWQDNLKRNGIEQYVKPIRGVSRDILEKWTDLEVAQEIDSIFIDGSHEYADVLDDFMLSYPIIKEGGWMAFHDVEEAWPGPERLWHETAKHILVNHEYCGALACGQKTKKERTNIVIETTHKNSAPTLDEVLVQKLPSQDKPHNVREVSTKPEVEVSEITEKKWSQETISLVRKVEDHVKKGNYYDAMDVLSKACKLVSNDPILILTRGRVLWKLGDRETARREFEKAVVLSPDYIPRLLEMLDL